MIEPGERVRSLDVFRGLTVASMLLVNNPGSWRHVYAPLQHAPWHGWTAADLIFPFFLFVVGITTQLSVSARRARGHDAHAIRRQILRRGALIFLFGILLNGFPYFTWGPVTDVADPSVFARVVDRLHHWRIMGVLQRIGLAYTISALIATQVRLRAQLLVTTVLLVSYWAVMTLVPVPGSNGTPGYLLLDQPAATMAAFWDRAFLDWSRVGLGNHLWSSTVTWDPEGILSTTGAICTARRGNVAGWWLGQAHALRKRVQGLFAVGALGTMLGLVWHSVFPINKNLWTSSYVVFTAGLACVSIAAIMWLVDVHGWRAWTTPCVIYGTNPLVAFAGSGVLARLIYTLIKVDYQGTRMPLQAAIYESLFASWLSPKNASLAFALAFVLLFFGILSLLYRRNILFKI